MNLTNSTKEDPLKEVCLRGTLTNIDAIGKVSIYIGIMIVSIIANLLVIFIVYRVQRMRIAFNYFIVNLSFSDFLITVFYMPRMLVSALNGFQWELDNKAGLIFCKIVPYFHEVLISVIVFTMLSVALERVFAVRYPLRRLITTRVATCIVVAIWFVSMTIRLPMIFGLQLVRIDGQLYCFFSFMDETLDLIYRNLSLAMFYVIPLIILTILYTILIVSLKRQRFPSNQISTHQRLVEKRERSIVKVLLCVVVSFALCWAMYFLTPVIYKYNPFLACRFFFLRYCLAHLNSALTPCTYFLFNENFRKGLRTVLSKCFPGLVRQTSTRIGPSMRGSDKKPNNVETIADNGLQLSRIQEISVLKNVEKAECSWSKEKTVRRILFDYWADRVHVLSSRIVICLLGLSWNYLAK